MRKNHLMGLLAKAVLGLSILGAFASQTAYAEQVAAQAQAVRHITGQIVDEAGVPVIGAAVLVNGATNKGTTTDVNGNFALDVPEGAVLTVSCIGYKGQEVAVGDKASFKIVLAEDTTLLNEVVHIGYGVQKRLNTSASVTSVKMEDVLGDRPVVNAVAALQGAIPGLQIRQNGNSQAQVGGQNFDLQIRGSYSMDGDEEKALAPLVLIDNVPGDLFALNPNDIESISVLKDAPATAIYGARAAAGVILVTTKRPDKAQKPTVNFSAAYGIMQPNALPKQVDIDRYISANAERGVTEWMSGQKFSSWQTYLDAYKKGGASAMTQYGEMYDGGVLVAKEDGKTYFLGERDIYRDMWPGGHTTDFNLSISGATDRVRYRIAGNSYKEDGIVYSNKDTFNRKTASAFVSADVTKWFTQEADIYYSNRVGDVPISKSSWYDAMDTGGDGAGLAYVPDAISPTGLPWDTNNNRIDALGTQTSVTSSPRIFTKSIFKPIEGLELVLEYTHTAVNYRDSKYDPSGISFTTPTMGTSVYKKDGQDIETVNERHEERNSLDAYATYNFNFGKNNFTVMAGYNQEMYNVRTYKMTAKGMSSTLIPSLSNASGDKSVSEGYDDYATRSGFFRVDYNYDDRYIVEVNGRYDGSSKFPKGHRFGFFPSVAVAWNVANEAFMKDVTWINQLKPRFSYGKVGNEASVGYYDYLASMTYDSQGMTWRSGDEDQYNESVTVPALVSSDFTWETITTTNFGLDFVGFDNRLTATFEYYIRDTDNILSGGGTAPAILGAAMPTRNIGSLRTKGWEFQVGWRGNIGRDFRYGISANIFDDVTKCTSISCNEVGEFGKLYPGKTVGEIWGYYVDGFYTIDDFQNTTDWTVKEGVSRTNNMYRADIGPSRPGDYKFINFNDGQGSYVGRENDKNLINEGQETVSEPGDMVVMGWSAPRYQYAFNLNAGYKGFDLSMMFQGVGSWQDGPNKQMWITHSVAKGGLTSRALFANTLVEGWYWQPMQTDNPSDASTYYVAKYPNAFLPRLYGTAGSDSKITSPNDKPNTRYMRERGYLRLKNVTLSYTLPHTLLDKINVSNIRVYVSCENLVTFNRDFTAYAGLDPEAGYASIPFNRTTSFGVNFTF